MIRFFAALSLALLVTQFTATAPVSAQDDLSAEERAQIEAVVLKLLKDRPEIVIDSIMEFQRRQKMAQLLPVLNMYRGFLENDPSSPVLGNPNGDITIVEFFDFRCGYCKRHYPELMKLVKADGNIKLVAKQYPILDRPGAPALSKMAARAGLAAHKQGKYEAYHTAIMASSGSLTEDRIYQIAGQAGIDINQLKIDMNSKLIDKSISNNMAIGNEIGFDGTPAYVIGNDILEGAQGYEALRKAVERARLEVAKGR